MTFDLAKQLWYIVVFNFYFVIAMVLELFMIWKYSNPNVKVDDKEIINKQKKIWGWPIYGPYWICKNFKKWLIDFCTKGIDM